MRSGMVSNTLTYPPSMGTLGSSNYQSGNMYSAPSSAPHMQPAPARVCNVSSEAQIVSSSALQPANIVFRKLPFFKLKNQILKPILLSKFFRSWFSCLPPTRLNLNLISVLSDANTSMTLPAGVRSSATQEFTVSFVLTCDMASDLAMHRDLTKNEYIMQVWWFNLIRIFLLLDGTWLCNMFYLGSDSNYCDR